MKINDGHTVMIEVNNDDVMPIATCPHKGDECTEAMKCTSSDLGSEVGDCCVEEAVAHLGWEAFDTSGKDILITQYPIPVAFWFHETDPDTPIVVPIGA